VQSLQPRSLEDVGARLWKRPALQTLIGRQRSWLLAVEKRPDAHVVHVRSVDDVGSVPTSSPGVHVVSRTHVVLLWLVADWNDPLGQLPHRRSDVAVSGAVCRSPAPQTVAGLHAVVPGASCHFSDSQGLRGAAPPGQELPASHCFWPVRVLASPPTP